MAYTGNMTFRDWSNSIQSKGGAFLAAIREGKILYDKFYQLTYGLTDEQILALPQFNVSGDSMTAKDLEKLRYALGVFNDMSQGKVMDVEVRESYLIPFLA